MIIFSQKRNLLDINSTDFKRKRQTEQGVNPTPLRML